MLENLTFSFGWTFFLQISNSFSIFLALYTISQSYNPFIFIFISIELIQLFDLLFYFLFKIVNPEEIPAIPNIKNKRRCVNLLKILYRFPQTLFLYILHAKMELDFFSEEGEVLLLSTKLLGLFDLIDFINIFKKYLISIDIKRMLASKMIENFLFLLFSHHLFASLWLILNKYEPEKSKNIIFLFLFYFILGFFSVYPKVAETPFMQYTFSFDMAVYVLSGTCFFDIGPSSKAEIGLTVFFMAYGFLLYGKIFGDIEHTIVLLKKENDKKKFLFLNLLADFFYLLNEKRKSFECCKEVSVILNLQPEIRKKIQEYFTKFEQKYYQSFFFKKNIN